MLINRRRAMRDTRTVVPLRKVLTLGLILPTLAIVPGCSRDTETVTAYSGPLYPGAGLAFEFAEVSADNPFELAAEFGDIYSDGGLAWYNAPLEPQVDNYSIADAESGKTLAAGEITVDMLPVAELELLGTISNDAVRGQYGEVVFSATGSEATRGSAEFELPGAGAKLTVSVDGDTASMAWDGTSIDGYGALGEEEAAALRALSTSPMARAISMVALDLGCREEAQSLDDAAFAALLFPWQVILKYEVADRGRVIPHFLAESSCSFSGFSEEGSNEALNVAVLWDNSNPVPTTLFLFPFDGKGQREARP